VKNHDFTPKNHFFFNFRGGSRAEWAPPPSLDLPLLTTSDHSPLTTSDNTPITHHKRSRSDYSPLTTSDHSPITLHSLQAITLHSPTSDHTPITQHKPSLSDYSALTISDHSPQVITLWLLCTHQSGEISKRARLWVTDDNELWIS
jgi:hypothetical protein